MSRIIRRGAARRDLIEIVLHVIREGSPSTARRFRERAEALFQRLAAMPGLGTRYAHEHPALAEVRYLPISGFKKYLVFYRPSADGIEVVRVLHGARDLNAILAEEFGIEEDADETP